MVKRTKRTAAKISIPGKPLTASEKKKIRAIMQQVSIRAAAHHAGLNPDTYHNVMSGKSKNIADLNKIVAAAKNLIQQRERLAV